MYVPVMCSMQLLTGMMYDVSMQYVSILRLSRVIMLISGRALVQGAFAKIHKAILTMPSGGRYPHSDKSQAESGAF